MKNRMFGLQRTTLVDYPGEVGATVFIPGCNLCCPYCHNPDFAKGNTDSLDGLVTEDQFIDFLEKRKSLLGGVCITGGEPLLYPDLPRLIEIIKQAGLKVKLDTNGSLPDRLASVEVDYIAMDLKTFPHTYHERGLSKNDITQQLQKSISYIIQSGTAHEFRTTCAPGIFQKTDIPQMARIILEAQRYYITGFRPGNTLDPAWRHVSPYTMEELQDFKNDFEKHGRPCLIR